MSVIQKGSPLAFSLGAGPAKIIKVGSGAEIHVHIEDARVTFSASSQEVMDGNGEVVSKVYYDNRRTLSMNIYVGGVTGTLTKAQAETNFESTIAPGDEIAISWAEWTEVDTYKSLTGDTSADGQGKYVVDTCEKTRQQGQYAQWSVTAIMYANDLTVTAS